MGLFRRGKEKPTETEGLDVDLRLWAAVHGLDFCDQESQLGYLNAFTFSDELQWNVCRGVLPGGEPGVVLHTIELIDGNRSPHTTAAVRIPEATGTLHGLRIGARDNMPAGDEAWSAYDFDSDSGPWRALIRRQANQDVTNAVIGGPVGDILAVARPGGEFSFHFMFGQLVVKQRRFLDMDSGLDGYCEQVSRLAAGIRKICAAASGPQQAFEDPLPEPNWVPGIRQFPNDRHLLAPWGMWADLPVAYAESRLLAVEDGLSFHQAFPRAAVPGEGACVMRGDGLRLVVAFDREAVEIAGGVMGANCAVLPAPGTPDTEADGIPADGGYCAVRDGMFYAWQAREGWQVDEEPLDRLTSWARYLYADLA